MSEEKTRKLEYRNLETAPIHYVNSVQLANSPFDVRFIMGVIEEANEEHIVTRVSAVMFMSPQHVKAFADVLNRHLGKYEAVHGTIEPLATPDATKEE